MISFTNGSNLFQTLSQNITAANATLYGQLANIEHRYLLQKYFNNEGSFSISTIGSNNLTVTSAPAINALTATLSVAWAFPTCTTVVTFSDGEVRNVNFTNNSTAISWQVGLVGTQFALTASPAAGATTATLQSAWSTATQTSLTQFSDGTTKTITFTKGSTAVSWTGGLTQAVNAYLNTSINTTSIAVGGVQFYRMPPNYSKLKDVTITVGNLKWTLDEIRTREEWDALNVFPYYADIPKNFFIYPGGDRGGQIGIWPIPSTTGNTITFNYKLRIPDLSLPDYGSLTYTGLSGALTVGNIITIGAITATITSFSGTSICVSNPSGTIATGAFTTSGGASGTISAVGNVSVTNGSSTVTGSGTAFTVTTNAGNESRWIQFAQPTGDNLWYQIASVDSTTSITLYQPYQGTTVTNSQGFTIGQMPLIAEDFQDMVVWKSLMYYFASIKKDQEQVTTYKDIYDSKIPLLNEYSSSNTIQVNLSRRNNSRNPNLYLYNNLG